MTRRRTVAGDLAAMNRCIARTERAKRITVRVELAVIVDLDDYCENYGVDDVATIRNDVKYAVFSAITDGSILANGIVDCELKNP